MKKKEILSDVLDIIIIYICLVIYDYCNSPGPKNKYNWLFLAIMVIISYLIIKLTSKKDKSNKK